MFKNFLLKMAHIKTQEEIRKQNSKKENKILTH